MNTLQRDINALLNDMTYEHPRYEIISQIIETRRAQNITQAELAKRVGTQKSNISRLESGNYNPSLDFLVKVVASLGKNIKIEIY